MALPFPLLTSQPELILNFRFGVFFFSGGTKPNQLDTRFKRVSGIAAEVKTEPQREGGQNLYTQKLPTGIEYQNLVLERGMVVSSPLNDEFTEIMTDFKFTTSNVIVTLYDEMAEPVRAWKFMKAFPVKWSTSDLNAMEKNLMIDTLELAYTHMEIMRL